MKRTLILAAAAAILASGFATAQAAPGNRGHGYGYKGHVTHAAKVTPRERAAIRRSAARLAALTRQVRADGRVTFVERIRLRAATARHQALVRSAYRS